MNLERLDVTVSFLVTYYGKFRFESLVSLKL